MEKKKRYTHLSFKERCKIETRLKDGYRVADIAKELGRARSTIYYEISRAKYLHRNPDWTEEERYSPDMAQKDYEWKQSAKGAKLKIDHDFKLIKFIEHMIINKNYSPSAVLMFIQLHNCNFDTEIRSVNTIYAYIKKGVFLNLTMEHLPLRGKRKKKRVVRQWKKQHGRSIEERPKHIDTRKEYGHWEMDCVVGKQGNKKTLLVLTERKTRYEIIEVMKSHTLHEVTKALNRIERRFGADFYKLFRTITVDNGSEFANQSMLEKAFRRKNKRTEVYYCHPYCSSERGSNENNNRLIRRFFPKGTNFDSEVTVAKIKSVEFWINNYPRKLLNGSTAAILFESEYKRIKNITKKKSFLKEQQIA